MQQDNTYELKKPAVKSPKRQTYRVQSELPPLYSRYYRSRGRTAQNKAELPFLGISQNFQKHAFWKIRTALLRRYFRNAVLPHYKRYECLAKHFTKLKAKHCSKSEELLFKTPSAVLPLSTPRYYRSTEIRKNPQNNVL